MIDDDTPQRYISSKILTKEVRSHHNALICLGEAVGKLQLFTHDLRPPERII